jgi:steroid delta-isomerase-like uncharacterized protein
MSTTSNKSTVRRFIDDVFVHCRTDSVDELVAPDFTPHSWPGVAPGTAGLKEAMKRVSAGLSDVRMDIDDIIAEDDKVAVRLTASAKHSGEFMGIPASGKSYRISETHIFRLVDGKVRDHWRDADMLGMMKQLGALPDPVRAGS